MLSVYYKALFLAIDDKIHGSSNNTAHVIANHRVRNKQYMSNKIIKLLANQWAKS